MPASRTMGSAANKQLKYSFFSGASPTLDAPLYFCNYRNMERAGTPCDCRRQPSSYKAVSLEPQRVFNTDSVLTEAVLTELKDQAPAGCVLCAIEAWDEEGWD